MSCAPLQFPTPVPSPRRGRGGTKFRSFAGFDCVLFPRAHLLTAETTAGAERLPPPFVGEGRGGGAAVPVRADRRTA